MKQLIPCLLALSVLGGCLGDAKEHEATLSKRENVAQKATGDFAVSTRPEPLDIQFTDKSGNQTRIKTPVTTDVRGSATTSERSSATGTFEESESFPFFVKLIGVGVGVAILIGIAWFVIRSSAAAKAAWSWTNEALTNKINTIQALKGASTDPARIQALSEAEAVMERLRADANA